MWDEVRRLRDEGMTVFLTTHYLDEADALCDRIAIIDHGQIVAEGTPAELKREISGDVVTVGVDGDEAKAAELLDDADVRAQGWRPPTTVAAAVRRRRRDRHPAGPAHARRRGHRARARSSCTGPASTTSS